MTVPIASEPKISQLTPAAVSPTSASPASIAWQIDMTIA